MKDIEELVRKAIQENELEEFLAGFAKKISAAEFGLDFALLGLIEKEDSG